MNIFYRVYWRLKIGLGKKRSGPIPQPSVPKSNRLVAHGNRGSESLQAVALQGKKGGLGKPYSYWGFYDDFLRAHSVIPDSILEIGVHKGDSTRILAERFPTARILALDLRLKPLDFNDFPNVTYRQVDQANRVQLHQVVSDFFPQGIDVVIDDASHIGKYSKVTFDVIFPQLRGGGVYFVEDWGTGYRPDWPDGSRFQPADSGGLHQTPGRISSHDWGMVGFVKSLVDLIEINESRYFENPSKRVGTAPKAPSGISALEIRPGVAMVLKTRGLEPV